MTKIVIPARYCIDTGSGYYTDGYTFNEELVDDVILDWVIQYDLNISYSDFDKHFCIHVRDDGLVALFKLTFPSNYS